MPLTPEQMDGQTSRSVETPLPEGAVPGRAVAPGATLPKGGLTPEQMGLAPDDLEAEEYSPVTAGYANQLGYAATDLLGGGANIAQSVGGNILQDSLGASPVPQTMEIPPQPSTPEEAEAASTNRLQQIHAALDPITGGQKPAPGSYDEKTIESMKAMMVGVPAAMAFPITSGAAALGAGLGVLGGVVGPYANKYVGDRYGEGAGTAAELALSVGVPIAGEMTAANVIHNKKMAKLVENATPEQRKLLDKVRGYVRDRLPDGTPPVTMQQMLEESASVKAAFPNTARFKGGKKRRNLIAEAIEQFKTAASEGARGERMRPTQILGGNARRGLSGMQEGLSDVRGLGDEFVSLAEGQEIQAVDRVKRAFREALPDGSPEEAIQFWEKSQDLAQSKARTLWKDVDLADMPYIPAEETLDRFDEIVEAAEGAEDLVPGFVKRLRKTLDDAGTEELTMTRVQNMRSKLLNIERNGNNITDAQAATKAKWAREARIELDRIIDGLPKKDGKAYSAARTATREWKELTDPKNAGGELIRSMSKDSGAIDSFGKTILKNRESAKRAKEIFGQDPKALAALQRSSMDEVFGSEALRKLGDSGDDLRNWDKSPRQIKKTIEKKYEALVEINGQEAVDNWLKITEWASQAATDRLAKKGYIVGAGSNKGARGAMSATGRFVLAPLTTGKQVLTNMLQSTGDAPTRIAMLQEFFYDPELMAGILELPTGPARPAYMIKLTQAAKRAAARASAQQAAQ